MKSQFLYRLFLPFALGYFISYCFRSVNAIIVIPLREEFLFSNTQIGLMTSMYFLAFALMQIPLGKLLDEIGPKKTNFYFLLISSFGAFFFSLSDSFFGFLVSRALIGIGVSAALMSSFKIITINQPKEKWTFWNGCILFFGGLGAMSATYPVEVFIEYFGWRSFFLFFGAFNLLICIVIYFFVPDKKYKVSSSFSLLEIILSKKFWNIVGVSILVQSFNMSVQTLWASPWLYDVHNFSTQKVSKILLVLASATTLGFFLWGYIDSILKSVSTKTIFYFGFFCFFLLQIYLSLGFIANPYLIWFLWGIFGTSASLTFAILSKSYPPEVSGRVTTALNFFIFIYSFFVQWFFGFLVDFFSISQNFIVSYQYTFLCFLLIQVTGFIFFNLFYYKK